MNLDSVSPPENLERLENNCACGAESTRGCHGFRDGEIYDEYYCDECFKKKE